MGYPNYESGGAVNLDFRTLAKYANNYKDFNIDFARCIGDFDNTPPNNLELLNQLTHDKMQNFTRKARAVVRNGIAIGSNAVMGGGGTTIFPSTNSFAILDNLTRVLIWEEKNDPKGHPVPFGMTKTVRLMMYEDIPQDTSPVTFVRQGGLVSNGVTFSGTEGDTVYGTATIFNDNKVYGVPQGATFDEFGFTFRRTWIPAEESFFSSYKIRYRLFIIASTGFDFSPDPNPKIYVTGITEGTYSEGTTHTILFNAGSFGISGWGFNSGQNTQDIKDATIKMYNLENPYNGQDDNVGSPLGTTNEASFHIDFGVQARFFLP